MRTELTRLEVQLMLGLQQLILPVEKLREDLQGLFHNQVTESVLEQDMADIASNISALLRHIGKAIHLEV